MKEHTLERNRMNVGIIVKPSVEFILYKTMKELILESNPMNVRKWERLVLSPNFQDVVKHTG